MKALVLAAGDGTRLRPISDSVPKHLIPIGNKPVIEYVVEDIRNAGITDIGVVVRDEGESPIATHLGSGDEYGVDLTYIVQSEPRGLAHAVKCGEGFVEEDPVLVYFGDTLVSPNVTQRLVDAFDEERHAASLGLQRVDTPSRYGIASFDDGGTLTGMEEKPDDPPSDLAYIGAVVFAPVVFNRIESQTPSDRGELELTDSIDLLIGNGQPVAWTEVDDLWMDVGTPEDVITANRAVFDGALSGTGLDHAMDDTAVVVGSGSRIHDEATVKGPVYIGSDTKIGADAVVGPYVSIGDRCHISSATIESSVVMDGVEISAGIHMNHSLIGQESEISTDTTSRHHQYILGSQVSMSM